jgi:hypothetical protein
MLEGGEIDLSSVSSTGAADEVAAGAGDDKEL